MAQTLLIDRNGRKPKWYQIILQAILPAIIVALLAWGGNKVHEMDKTLAVVVYTVKDTNEKVVSFETKLESHSETTKKILEKNSDIHHSKLMKVPCEGCHISKERNRHK